MIAALAAVASLLIVGDSIVAANPNLDDTIEHCTEHVVDTWSYPGVSADWVGDQLWEWHQYEAVVVNLGANDLPYIDSISEAHKRIWSVLSKIEANGPRGVYWIGVHHEWLPQQAELWNTALRQWEAIGILTVVPWFNVAETYDGVHPTTYGQGVFAGLLCGSMRS